MLPINERLALASAQNVNQVYVDPVSKIDQASACHLICTFIGIGRILNATSHLFIGIGKSIEQGHIASREFDLAGKNSFRGIIELSPFMEPLYSKSCNRLKAKKYALELIQAEDYTQVNRLINKYSFDILESLHRNKDYMRIFLCCLIFDAGNIDGIALESIMRQFLRDIDSFTEIEKEEYKFLFEKLKNKKYNSGNNTNLMLLMREIICDLDADA